MGSGRPAGAEDEDSPVHLLELPAEIFYIAITTRSS